MYGVPKNLDLSAWVGSTLIQIGLGEHQIQFIFHPEKSASCERYWELRGPDEVILDKAPDEGRSLSTVPALKIHVLLGLEVASVDLDPPRSFTFCFQGGYRLTIYDTKPGHEAAELWPDGVII